MTRMIDRLAAKGLLERIPGTVDRRAISLRLTPAGDALVGTLPAIFEQVAGRLVAGLDLDRLLDEADRMGANLASDAVD
jgi:DNA-binding MarR family transcriptional regulator